jgi:pimeloyl-ACP methyl ester carboxylesterase
MPEFSDLKDPLELKLDDGVVLFLRRMPNPGCPPVLLLHGASACHKSFTIPASDGGTPRCLADCLHKEGFEPWLLDWRGSRLVVDDASQRGVLGALKNQFTFDRAAERDIPAALKSIREQTDARPICAVGHCMGAGTLAQSIASGHIDLAENELTHVVLLTLGLFYVPAWDSRVKSHDFILERLQLSGDLVVDPRPRAAQKWGREMQEIYDNWPNALRQHREPVQNEIDEMCNRLSFMYGPPYLEQNLAPGIHGTLEQQFGAIPLRMFLQAGQNVRRGWAAPIGTKNDDTSLIGDGALKRFETLKSITLVTGSRNQLWHRDSIDRMAEWLRRGRGVRPAVHILEDYGHQDLLWGKNAPEDVFDKIRNGLPRDDARTRRSPSPHRTSETAETDDSPV